ncbi:hypothetical protein chiPu_0032148, partial [Chiloscyllium punctatum]|nr:hypothetical protein [Chiloscyllium punctatum]
AEVIPAGVDREDRRHPQQHDADQGGCREHLLARLAGDQKADRDQLDRRLPFRKLGDGNADPEPREIFAQARDQDLAAQDHDRRPQRPAVDRIVGGQHQEAGGHQQLVGDRIEHPAERGLLVPHPGVIAVEIVGDPRRDEHGKRHPAQPQRAVQDRLPVDAADHHRNGGNPGVGQDIREGHGLGLSPGRSDVHPFYQYR